MIVAGSGVEIGRSIDIKIPAASIVPESRCQTTEWMREFYATGNYAH
jgi:hypothetical protein